MLPVAAVEPPLAAARGLLLWRSKRAAQQAAGSQAEEEKEGQERAGGEHGHAADPCWPSEGHAWCQAPAGAAAGAHGAGRTRGGMGGGLALVAVSRRTVTPRAMPTKHWRSRDPHKHFFVVLLQAKQMADFLAEVLRWDPDSRATAEQMLQHAWLQSVEPLQLS